MKQVDEQLAEVRAELGRARDALAGRRKAAEAAKKAVVDAGINAADPSAATEPVVAEAKAKSQAREEASATVSQLQGREAALLNLLGGQGGSAPAGLPGHHGNGPVDPFGLGQHRSESGAWLAGQIQASLGTADIGTISDASVVFHRLVTPASALLASGPTVVDIDTTTGQVLLVNGRMTPAAVVPEGEPIEAEDPPVELADVRPPKYGKLVELSTEAYRDATPQRVAIAEAAMVEAIGSGIDLACFHGRAGSAQVGLQNTAEVGAVAAGGEPTNLDPFVSALAALRRGMRRGTAFYMSPVTWERLGHLKKSTDSNEPLVSAQLSATGQPAESILGVPVFQSDQIDEDIAFAARAAELVVIRRQDVEVEVDPHYGFGSAEVGVRAITRLKLVVGDPTAVCLIEGLTGS